MKPVMQTRFGNEEGNCFDACLASLLEVPLETIPHLNEENWVDATNAWLMKEFGCFYFEFEYNEAMAFPVLGYHVMSGISPRSPDWPRLYHSVIGYQGKMVHDPHPDGTGIKGKIRYGLIVPCDPAPDSRLRSKDQGRNLLSLMGRIYYILHHDRRPYEKSRKKHLDG